MKQRLSRHSTPSRTALMVGYCYFQFAEICVKFFSYFMLSKIVFAAARLVIDVFILLVFCLVAQVTSEPESRNFFLRRDQDFGCWWTTMAALGSVGRGLPSGRRIVFIFLCFICVTFQHRLIIVSCWVGLVYVVILILPMLKMNLRGKKRSSHWNWSSLRWHPPPPPWDCSRR